MKKLRNILLTLLFTIALIFIVQKSSYAASDFSYKSMDFDVEVNEDGSMDVVETWTIDIDGETNTLFKNWDLDLNKFSSISDVRVTEVVGGKEKELRDINKEMYHVTTDCYYALEIDNDKFEIAWGVNDDSGIKKYKMYYTVNDCVKVYNDCSDIYWKFVNNTSNNTVKNVTGTIKLPNSVSDMDNLKIWGHGNVNGETKKVDDDTLSFSAKNYNSEYLEVRIVVTEDDMFPTATRIYRDMLDDILEYEKDLADKANFEKAVRFVIAILFIIAISALNIFLLSRAIKKKNILKENPKKVPTQVFEYFRDFPRKDDTPAQTAFLHYFNMGKTSGTNAGKILSATMLDLCIKKFISFEINQSNVSKNEKVIVKLNKEKESSELANSEKAVWELFVSVSEGKDTFTMKELEKYAQAHSTKFYSSVNKLADITAKEEEEIGNYNTKEAKEGAKYNGRIGLMIFLLIFEMIFGINIITILAPSLWVFLIIEPVILIYTSIIYGKVGSRLSGITQAGVDEQEKLRALKKYLQEFSLIKDREVPELVLWEKYLVYATTMGIADKVLEQLKVVYPEITEGTDLANRTSYLYIMSNHNVGSSFISALNSSTSKAYTYSAPSSSSGGGGGFSGGGGGGRWRWLQRRSLIIKNIRNNLFLMFFCVTKTPRFTWGSKNLLGMNKKTPSLI